jgi:hypothetical protein
LRRTTSCREVFTESYENQYRDFKTLQRIFV